MRQIRLGVHRQARIHNVPLPAVFWLPLAEPPQPNGVYPAG